MLEFNGHEMSNKSNLEWNREKFIIRQELQFFFFAPKVESMENTNQFSKDETLIEEKSILTQELKLGGQQMSNDFILGEWQENAKESMDINKPLDSMFLF